MDKNYVELEGNVTRDVEMQPSGKFCYVSIAVGRKVGSGTDFISIKAFGEVAKNCAESLRKGDRVAVEAYVSSSNFTPKGAEEKVYRTDIVANTLKKLPKGGGVSAGGFVDESAAA